VVAAVLIISACKKGSDAAAPTEPTQPTTPTTPPPATGEVFLAISTSTSINVYRKSDVGNATPIRSIFGGNSNLSEPGGIALDLTNKEIVVANRGNSTITVHALEANGNVPPLRTIGGPKTQLSMVPTPLNAGVFVDPVHGEIGVVNVVTGTSTGYLAVFSRTANGDGAPLRVLKGAATMLVSPRDVEVDLVHDEIFVADCSPARIFVFSRTAQGNVAPTRWFDYVYTTSEGGSRLPGACGDNVGMSIDNANGEIFVTLGNGTRVFARNAGSSSGGTPAPLRSVGTTGGVDNYLDSVSDEVGIVVTAAFIPSRYDVYPRTSGSIKRSVSLAGITSRGFGIAVRP
jgi:hypothetical protein